MKEIMNMKKYSRFAILTVLVLALGCIGTANAIVIPPQGAGQIGISAVVMLNDLPVYAAPDASSKVLMTLETGRHVIVLEQADGWAKFTLSDSVDETFEGWADADSGEFAPDSLHKVIDFLPGQSDEKDKGGTLRLGAYPCRIVPGTLMERCYGLSLISERHRHRYEFSNEFRDALSEAGLALSGLSPDGNIVETVEVPGHPFYLGVQFHPEFKSRPNKPHPLFSGFIEAALRRRAAGK